MAIALDRSLKMFKQLMLVVKNAYK